MIGQPEADPEIPARERILDAAAALFAEEGFSGARVDEIARRAGINKAMLYYHVGDKEAMYRAVLDHNFAAIVGAVQRRVAAASSPPERLRAFIEALALEVREIDHHRRIMLREIASGGTHLDNDVFTRIRPLVETLRFILAEGAENGDFRPTNPLPTHLSIVGAVVFITSVFPMVHRMLEQLPEAEVAGLPRDQLELAFFLHDLLLRGLQRRETEGEPI